MEWERSGVNLRGDEQKTRALMNASAFACQCHFCDNEQPVGNRANHIPTLDGWRALAIFMVLIQHATISAGHSIPLLSKLGPHGVQIFFVLSGYLITTRFLEDDCSLHRFYVKRVFRILPLVCLYLAVLWLLRAKLPLVRGELLSSLFFARNYTISAILGHNAAGWFTTHFWSLALEEQFYLLWPPILAFAGMRAGRRIAMYGVVAVFLWRVLCTFIGPSIYSPTQAWYLRPEFHFDSLLLGCVLALTWPAVRSRFKRRRLLASISFLLWIALVVMTPSFPSTLEALAVAGMITATVLHPTGLTGRLLETHPLRFVGRISYGLYVWQQLFLVPEATGHPLGRLQTWPLSILVVFVIGATSYYAFERPLLRIGDRMWREHPRQRLST